MTDLLSVNDANEVDGKDSQKSFTIICGFHIYSLIVTNVLDCVWTVPECIAFPLMPILCPILAVICFIAVLLIQMCFAHDGKLSAFIKAVILAIVAGVPYPATSILFSMITTSIQVYKNIGRSRL